ncbi:hypothetical protein K1719_038566 [Acacia pycnantha]|nr:hypothetical protein K1719_038566 [Acacia pycnantha]
MLTNLEAMRKPRKHIVNTLAIGNTAILIEPEGTLLLPDIDGGGEKASHRIHVGWQRVEKLSHGDSKKSLMKNTDEPTCFFGLFLLFFFEVLKETLLRHGFTFESETDTEVIPKLAKFVFDKANEAEALDCAFILDRSWFMVATRFLSCGVCMHGFQICRSISQLSLPFFHSLRFRCHLSSVQAGKRRRCMCWG